MTYEDLHVKEKQDAARAKNPERWTGTTRDWRPVRIVRLNPNDRGAVDLEVAS